MISGLIFDIKRFAVHDGPGIRTTIFFKGCPLSCWWCHNPESRSGCSQPSMKRTMLDGEHIEREEITGTTMTVQEVLEKVERDRLFYEESSGGVTLSGGEPLFQPDFCEAILRSLKSAGFHTALDTTGYATRSVIQRTAPYTDLFLYDLKLMDDRDHLTYTGVSNREILENLKMLIDDHKTIIIRFPVIPDITDSDQQIGSMIDWLERYGKGGIREIHLLPYHHTAKNKYRRFQIEEKMKSGATVMQEELENLRARFERSGFQVGIGG